MGSCVKHDPILQIAALLAVLEQHQTRHHQYRYYGVTSSGIVVSPLRHPACALLHEELPEPKKTGNHQAKPSGCEMSHPFAGRMKVMVHSQAHRTDSNL